jgi:hypothetical protein
MLCPSRHLQVHDNFLLPGLRPRLGTLRARSPRPTPLRDVQHRVLRSLLQACAPAAAPRRASFRCDVLPDQHSLPAPTTSLCLSAVLQAGRLHVPVSATVERLGTWPSRAAEDRLQVQRATGVAAVSRPAPSTRPPDRCTDVSHPSHPLCFLRCLQDRRDDASSVPTHDGGVPQHVATSNP